MLFITAPQLSKLPPSQYCGYDPRLVTEWVLVRIPSKAWLCFFFGKRSRTFTCNGFPSRKERGTPLLLYAGNIVCNKCEGRFALDTFRSE
ncbi:hypothetical protein TNCV_4543701 [Trichonephila clavipes]|nr:hypothetical protein TNCV_4543701 [Trichonephila clavipes]